MQDDKECRLERVDNILFLLSESHRSQWKLKEKELRKNEIVYLCVCMFSIAINQRCWWRLVLEKCGFMGKGPHLH